MKKRKLSISTAKFVVESAESLEATQQFSVVTEFKAGDNVVPAGKLVTIDNIKDNVIEFHTNDNVDVKLSTPESVFVVNTQLMSNEMLNESIDGKQFAEKFDKFDDKQKQVSIDLLDLSEKPSADEIAKAFDAATTDTQESLCKQVGIVDESIEDDAKSWYDNMSAEERAAAIDGLGHWSEKKFDELSADTQRAIVENFKAKDDLDESIEFVNKAPYAIDGTSIKPGDAVKVEVVADGALAAVGEQVRIKVSAGEESTELIVNKNDKQWIANVVDEAFDVSSVDASSLASMLLQSITEAHRIHLNNEFGPHVNKYAAHKILDDFYKGFPELVDSFVEQLRYDGVTLTRSDYSWSDALIGMKELIAAIDVVYDTVDSASKSELDAIKSFLKKHAWMLENQAGFVAGKVVVESWEDNYNDKSDMDKLSAIKVALMSDNLDYDAEYIKSLPVKDWPDEVKDAVQLVCESELQDAYRDFFKAKLAEYGVASPAELDAEQKSKFFSEIKKEWPDAKEELDLDEAAECPIKKANIFALSKAYTAEQNNETLAKIEELFAEAGVQGGLMFDKSAEQLDDANFAKLAKLLNVDLVTESVVTKKPVRKRSFLMAQKFINENLEAGQNLTTTATLTTVDGYAIPANEQIALTSIDSNTNLAYVTYGEHSYAVTYGDLIAAIDTSVA